MRGRLDRQARGIAKEASPIVVLRRRGVNRRFGHPAGYRMRRKFRLRVSCRWGDGDFQCGCQPVGGAMKVAGNPADDAAASGVLVPLERMRMRSAALTVAILAVLLAWTTGSALTVLSNPLPAGEPLMATAHVTSGQAHYLYVAGWRNLPHIGHWSIMLDVPAAVVMAALMSVIVFLCLRSGRASCTLAGVACLLSAGIPYAIGSAVLAGNADFERAAPWLATMLASVLYGCLACSALAMLDLVRIRRLALGRRPVQTNPRPI
jgi:hypothetical protein